jgi:hypothetical protein
MIFPGQLSTIRKRVAAPPTGGNMGSLLRLSKYSFYEVFRISAKLCSMFTKRSEFHAWLVEERKINPETLSKDQERKEFAHFIEDFNTGV